MRPSGETIVLDTRPEMKTLELGAELIDAGTDTLPRHIDAGAYSKDPSDPLYGMDPMIGQVPLRNVEAINIKPENRDVAVSSLEAVVALGGLQGVKAKLLGRKRVARTILQELDR